MGTWKYQVSTYRRHQFPFPFTLSKEMSLPAAIGLSLNVVFILFLIGYTCCCLYNGVLWISLIVLKLRGAGMVSSHWHLQAHGAADLFRCLSHLCGTKRIGRVVHVHLFASSSQTRKPKSQFCCDDLQVRKVQSWFKVVGGGLRAADDVWQKGTHLEIICLCLEISVFFSMPGEVAAIVSIANRRSNSVSPVQFQAGLGVQQSHTFSLQMMQMKHKY